MQKYCLRNLCVQIYLLSEVVFLLVLFMSGLMPSRGNYYLWIHMQFICRQKWYLLTGAAHEWTDAVERIHRRSLKLANDRYNLFQTGIIYFN